MKIIKRILAVLLILIIFINPLPNIPIKADAQDYNSIYTYGDGFVCENDDNIISTWKIDSENDKWNDVRAQVPGT